MTVILGNDSHSSESLLVCAFTLNTLYKKGKVSIVQLMFCYICTHC
jgi:hypothetical protein